MYIRRAFFKIIFFSVVHNFVFASQEPCKLQSMIVETRFQLDNDEEYIEKAYKKEYYTAISAMTACLTCCLPSKLQCRSQKLDKIALSYHPDELQPLLVKKDLLSKFQDIKQ